MSFVTFLPSGDILTLTIRLKTICFRLNPKKFAYSCESKMLSGCTCLVCSELPASWFSICILLEASGTFLRIMLTQSPFTPIQIGPSGGNYSRAAVRNACCRWATWRTAAPFGSCVCMNQRKYSPVDFYIVAKDTFSEFGLAVKWLSSPACIWYEKKLTQQVFPAHQPSCQEREREKLTHLPKINFSHLFC